MLVYNDIILTKLQSLEILRGTTKAKDTSSCFHIYYTSNPLAKDYKSLKFTPHTSNNGNNITTIFQKIVPLRRREWARVSIYMPPPSKLKNSDYEVCIDDPFSHQKFIHIANIYNFHLETLRQKIYEVISQLPCTPHKSTSYFPIYNTQVTP